ncbi:MAG: ribbon-helix-helix protein, CopG family [Gemmatimonadetes bacterium]|nr:ribbon-helix-helix protein, CopG family [Gemmatimonadota bacterium]
MAEPVTLRLSQEARARIARIARRRGVSASEIIREAIEGLVEREEAFTRPYDAVADLIGTVHGGRRSRSTATGRQFTEQLRRRARS